MGIPFREIKTVSVRNIDVTGFRISNPQILFQVPTGRTWLCVSFAYRFPTKPSVGSFNLSLFRSDGVYLMNVTGFDTPNNNYINFSSDGAIANLLKNLVLNPGESIRLGDSTGATSKVTAALQYVESYGG